MGQYETAAAERERQAASFSTAILKLTAFCNLNCSYCYMFNLADRTYSRVPRRCSIATATTAVRQLAEHAHSAGRHSISVVLHGGEPLLWPFDHFQALFKAIAQVRTQGISVNVSLQTNGLAAPEAVVDLLDECDATLGFSLDGPKEINDRFRVTHTGKGSYDRVVQSMARILDRGFPMKRVGVLSVMNPSMTPHEYFDWAAELPVQNVSLLWPIEYSWESPPWKPGKESDYAAAPRFGIWMSEAFSEWWECRLEETRVRQFLDTICRLMGGSQHSDSIGNDFVDMFVVNTDGGIEYPDYLRAHQDGGSRTPYNVHTHKLDEIRTADPMFRSLLRLRESIPVECHGCPNEDVCGGGFLAGRSSAEGFSPSRRSVLCYDQMYYFNAVRAAVAPYFKAMETFEIGGEA